MSIQGISSPRVTSLMQSNSILNQINSTESQLMTTQQQLSTGHRISEPGDDPGAAAIVMQLNRTLDQQTTYQTNLASSQSQLSQVDSSLGSLNTLLIQANSIASQNVGSEVSASQRQSAATIIESIYSQTLTLGNTQFEGQYVFGGDKSDNPPFVTANGGVQFVGSDTVLSGSADVNTTLPFQVTASSVFGALSSRVSGSVDLAPNATGATRIIDLQGATNQGVQLGTIQISNGTTSAQVDLSHADNVQDVVDAINNAAVGGISASISGDHLVLGAGASDNISVTDIGGGSTAATLGIAQATGAGAGTNVTGASLQPAVTVLTPISALKGGAGIDTTHGITITNGGTTANIDLTGVTTVGDLINKINNSGTHVQAQVNAAGTGIDILNPIQGTQMSIAENGGTTASDLGIRSFTPATELSELNEGRGVGLGTGGPDMQITRSDGATFGVSLTGAKTIQDVISAINTADAGGGVTASFATTGNGIVLKDTTTGPNPMSITSQNFSTAVKDLGLDGAAVGGVITGKDVDSVETQGVFADLAKLRDALNSNDQAAITRAAESLQKDQEASTDVRGQAGAMVQQLQSRQDTISSQQIATKSMISQLQDADYATTITKFTQLQTALQATLMTAAKTLSQSLLNFLG